MSIIKNKFKGGISNEKFQMRNFKKVLSLSLASIMMFSVAAFNANATEAPTYTAVSGVPTEDGTYRANTTMWNDNYVVGQQASMCDVMFSEYVDFVIEGDEVTIDLFVLKPVPNFPDLGVDGTLKDVQFSYGEKVEDGEATITSGVGLNGPYDPTTNIDTLYDRNFVKANPGFGIVADTVYPTQKLTVTMPVQALAETHIDVQAFVNVVMMSTQNFNMELTNIEKLVGGDTTGPTEPENETRDVVISASVPENQSTFTVEVPESVDMGNLRFTEDTVISYSVNVNFVAGNDNKAVQVSTEDMGVIKCEAGDETIAFANDFGTQKTSETQTLTGNITVTADDVQAAPVGDYTGTMTFEISTVNA